MFKVIVAGGRDFNNYEGLSNSLDYLFKNINDDIRVVCGWLAAQTGLASDMQKNMGIKSSIFQPIGI